MGRRELGNDLGGQRQLLLCEGEETQWNRLAIDLCGGVAQLVEKRVAAALQSSSITRGRELTIRIHGAVDIGIYRIQIRKFYTKIEFKK